MCKSKELTSNLQLGKESKAELGQAGLPNHINIKAILEENERLKNENLLLKAQSKKALELAVQLKKTKIAKLSVGPVSSQQNSVSEPVNKENVDPELEQILDSPNRSNGCNDRGSKKFHLDDRTQALGVFKRTVRQQKNRF